MIRRVMTPLEELFPNAPQKLRAFANDRNGYSKEWTSIINLIDSFTTLGLLDQNLTSSPTKSIVNGTSKTPIAFSLPNIVLTYAQ